MIDDMRQGFNIGSWLLYSWSMAYLPFLRTSFGVRGMEGYSFWAFVIILAYGTLGNSPAMVWGYLPAWVLMVIWRKLRADSLQHSAYQGWPWLTGWMIRDEYLARCAEAGLMILIGALLSRVDESVGLFVSGGVIALGAKYVYEHVTHMRQVRAAMDWHREAELWQEAMEEAARRQRKGR
jgi:hypothetical protein